MISLIKAAGIGALVGLTAACASKSQPPVLDGRPLATAADAHRIKVSQVGERLEVSIVDGSLSADSLRAIDDFTAQYRAVGHGAFSVSTPKDANPRMSSAVLTLLTDLGVSSDALTVSKFDSADPTAPLVLSFVRFEAEAPNCRSISDENLAGTLSNRPKLDVWLRPAGQSCRHGRRSRRSCRTPQG
jgi:pilus assembly protein CpaD